MDLQRESCRRKRLRVHLIRRRKSLPVSLRTQTLIIQTVSGSAIQMLSGILWVFSSHKEDGKRWSVLRLGTRKPTPERQISRDITIGRRKNKKKRQGRNCSGPMEIFLDSLFVLLPHPPLYSHYPQLYRQR